MGRNRQQMTSVLHTLDTAAGLESETERLGRVLAETSHSRSTWSDQEYGPIMLHQLSAPLGADLTLLFPQTEDTLTDDAPRSFEELLLHPSPPLPALILVKDFAKQLSRNARFAYPRPVAMMLYYASICAAWLRTGTRITNLSDAEIRKGVCWALKRSWLPASLKSLFESTRRRLHGA